MTKVLNGIAQFKTLIELVLLMAALLFFTYGLNANVIESFELQKEDSKNIQTILVSLDNKGRDHNDFKDYIVESNEINSKIHDVLVEIKFHLQELRKEKQ